MTFRANILLALCAVTVAAAETAARESASSYAGSTVSAVFPPPNATNTAIDTYFPDASEVGNAGPTPTGDESWVVETAPSAPQKDDVYPLVNPSDAQATLNQSSTFNMMRFWGNLSPWWSLGGALGLPDATEVLPAGCELTQAHLLHRHGARYPTSGSGPSQFATKINTAATSTGFSASGPLDFLNTWTYKLGSELLTPFGRQQLFELGIAFRVKYGHLLKDFTDLPVFRTTSEARMVDSALHFAAGFFGVQQYQNSYHQLIEIEADGYMNSLDPFLSCPNGNNAAGSLGFSASANWTQIYLNNTVSRLQRYIKGVELDIDDVAAMQQLCSYETVAIGYSAFCDLFTEDEWRGYEYSNDLELWYSYGPGNPSAAAQGIGYVQEMVARLTQTPITDFSRGLNQTLDESNVTFPLSQPIYVDATHDTVISQMLVAFNFTSMAANGPLPVDHIPKDQTYFGSWVVPFATHLVGQVMSCPASSDIGFKTNGTQSYIRFFLNDGAVPLNGIAHCPENKHGLCPLDDFIQGMNERIAQVDYQYDCYANYTAPWPDPIIDGRMKR